MGVCCVYAVCVVCMLCVCVCMLCVVFLTTLHLCVQVCVEQGPVEWSLDQLKLPLIRRRICI